MAVIEAQSRSSLTTALVAGALIGFAVIFAIVAAALLIAGSGLVSAVGVALFVAAFGGPGFGTMFGANWHVHRHGDSV